MLPPSLLPRGHGRLPLAGKEGMVLGELSENVRDHLVGGIWGYQVCGFAQDKLRAAAGVGSNGWKFPAWQTRAARFPPLPRVRADSQRRIPLQGR